LALHAAIGDALVHSLCELKESDAGFFNFLVTASRILFFELSSVFWRLMPGLFVHLLMSRRRKKFVLERKPEWQG
jgi:predicted benzoate:H+ symporter BenE